MNKRFWKNKSVLVTGHQGFLGSHITKRLISCGAKVTGLDIRGRSKNILNRLDYKKFRSLRGNVANQKLVGSILSKYKVEIVFHVAAEAIVGECQKNPLKGLSSNIQGTWTLLEASRNKSRIKAIIVASSDKAYGIHNKLPYKEDARLNGIHPYDVSKSCADLISYTYHHTYGVPVVVTRCGNIYGPGDFNFSRIVPDMMKSIVRNKTLLIRSNGKFTRDYIFIDDICDGYLLLAQQYRKQKLSGEAFNFSNESPISVLNLVKTICRLSDKKQKYKVLNKAKYEIPHQYLSSAKAKRKLKWRPKHSLDKGLKQTIRWYKEAL